MVRILSPNLDSLAAAAEVVANGGIVAYPTDTVYGLGCDPFNFQAVKAVLRAKGERSKPLPVLVETIQSADVIVDFSRRALKVAAAFWPGPLTMVLKAKPTVPSILAPDKTVGVRSPKHAVCLKLLGMCSGMLVGTSANKTGQPPATTANEVAQELGDQIDLLLDGGRTMLGVSSTVLDLTKGFRILREGPISREELLKCVRNSI
ncbi:MAG: L-threonylcarbamoyladenylate synthase [Candidatus Bathyarchaeia archaeon]|jgi:L-threonylcarbamoyladenylate synthase